MKNDAEKVYHTQSAQRVCSEEEAKIRKSVVATIERETRKYM